MAGENAVGLREFGMIVHVAFTAAAILYVPYRFGEGHLGWRFLFSPLSGAASGAEPDTDTMRTGLWMINFVGVVLVAAGSLRPEIKISPKLTGIIFCAAGSLLAVLFMPYRGAEGSLGHHFLPGGLGPLAGSGGSVNVVFLLVELVVVNAIGGAIMALSFLGGGDAPEENGDAEA